MKIRVGFEMLYDFPQPTPMIMVLGTHFTRASDMGVVAADALALVVNLPRRRGCAGVLIAERNVAMNKITDGLHARPARLCILEQLPCDVGQPIGLAITAAKQINECVGRQVFHGMLTG
jgi:hypothetical protein